MAKSRYAERKQKAREEAIGWQINDRELDMSWTDLVFWSNYFNNLGRRYGLLKEFRENGIPC